MSIEDTALNRSGNGYALVKSSVEKNGIGGSATLHPHQRLVLMNQMINKIRNKITTHIGFGKADPMDSHGIHEDQRELSERFINSSLQMEITVSRSVISSRMLLFTIETFDCDLSEKYGLWAQFTVPYSEEDEDVFWKKADFSPLMSELDKFRTRRIFDMNIIPENSFSVRAIGLSVKEMEKHGWFPMSKTYTPRYFKNENGSAWLTSNGKVFARANSDKSKVGMANDSRTDSFIEVSRIATDPVEAFKKLEKMFQFKTTSHD